METKKEKKIISDTKLQEKIGWRPHQKQEEILLAVNAGLRQIVVSAGRRMGKSNLCAYIALKLLLQPNKKIWIVAPTYDLSQKVFNYLVRYWAKVAPSQIKGVSYRPTPRIKTAGGSILECKSTENPAGLLGEELDLIIMDEASRIPPRIWESYLFPATSSRQGQTVFISTPLGKNWFYHLWVKANEKGGAFQFQSKDNPYFKMEEWELAKNTLPQDVFSQEYLAHFLDDAAAVFRGIRSVIVDNCLSDRIQDHYYIIGADLGKHQDFTVLTVIDTLNNKVVHIDRFNQLDWNIQKARIKSLAQRYNNARIIIDSTGIGDPITDDLRADGLVVDDYLYTNKSKKQMIEKLMVFIEQQMISIPDNEILINEIESFGFDISENGRTIYSAPQGGHDDCVNSLGLAVWGLVGSPIKKNALQQELAKVKRHNVKNYI